MELYDSARGSLNWPPCLGSSLGPCVVCVTHGLDPAPWVLHATWRVSPGLCMQHTPAPRLSTHRYSTDNTLPMAYGLDLALHTAQGMLGPAWSRPQTGSGACIWPMGLNEFDTLALEQGCPIPRQSGFACAQAACFVEKSHLCHTASSAFPCCTPGSRAQWQPGPLEWAWEAEVGGGKAATASKATRGATVRQKAHGSVLASCRLPVG